MHALTHGYVQFHEVCHLSESKQFKSSQSIEKKIFRERNFCWRILGRYLYCTLPPVSAGIPCY